MGRTAKFSFPLPGRKQGYGKSKSAGDEPRLNGLSLSKAQRFFGTESDLNIDSPTRDDDGIWHSRELGPMSIAISESTDDLDDSDDDESAVLPARVLYGRASSTLLGRQYQGSSDSRKSRDLQSERSSSTLKSYYDRQKAPLAVSQQTSASSVRDLALRKGQPIVTSPRSPLMRVDFPGVAESVVVDNGKRKPTKLDLSKLMSKTRKEVSEGLMLSPDTYNPRESRPESRFSKIQLVKDPETPTRPPKANRKVDFRRISRPISVQTTAIQVSQQLAEPSIPPRTRVIEQRLQIASDLSGQWRESQQWDNKSTESKSSLNTKSSKRSAFSQSDLHATSVLSLSSDEDAEEETRSPLSRERDQNRSMPKPRRILSQIDEHPPSLKTPDDEIAMIAQDPTFVTIPAQDGNFLTIPLPVPGSSRLSGPWGQGGEPGRRNSVSNARFQRQSVDLSHEPTPPLSPPSSLELREGSDRSSRLMAVTKQEEALLEALRQKRARMREKIIGEHDITISPPRIDPEIVARAVTALGAPFREQKPVKGKERILLFLDRPLTETHVIDTAEPSPDLSDFLSFGSDEEDDYTPRTSWIPPNDLPRPDSMISPSSGNRTPLTPQSAVRLSAVGAGLFASERKRKSEMSFLSSVRNANGSREDVLDEEWSL